MGVCGAGLSQLQRSVSVLASHGRTLVYSLVTVLLVVLAAPVLLPAWVVKSTGGWVALQQAAVGSNWVAGAVLGGYFRDALDAIEDERDGVTAERDAFSEFAEEVQSLSVRSRPTGGETTARVTDVGSQQQTLRELRESYRETVMAVPDYDEEYGEGLRENFAAEFSPHLASVVVDGHQFTRPVQQLLVQQSRQAARRREKFLGMIDDETQSLKATRSRLRGTDGILAESGARPFRTQPFSRLVATDEEIRDTQRECRRLLAKRQRDVHRINGRFSQNDGSTLQEYLYEDLDVSFPALAATLDRLDQLRDRRSALVRAIWRRE